MDEEYLSKVFEHLGDIDKNFKKNTSIDWFIESMKDKSYAEKVYNHLGNIDNNFKNKTSIEWFYNKVGAGKSSNEVEVQVEDKEEVEDNEIVTKEKKIYKPNKLVEEKHEYDQSQLSNNPILAKIAQSASPTGYRFEQFRRAEQIADGKSVEETEDAYNLFSERRMEQKLHPSTGQPFTSKIDYLVEDVISNANIGLLDDQNHLRTQLTELTRLWQSDLEGSTDEVESKIKERLEDFSVDLYGDIQNITSVENFNEIFSSENNIPLNVVNELINMKEDDFNSMTAKEFADIVGDEYVDIIQGIEGTKYHLNLIGVDLITKINKARKDKSEIPGKETLSRESKNEIELAREKRVKKKIEDLNSQLEIYSKYSTKDYDNYKSEIKALKTEREILELLLSREEEKNQSSKEIINTIFKHDIDSSISKDDPYYEAVRSVYSDNRIKEIVNELYDVDNPLFSGYEGSAGDLILEEKGGSFLNWDSKAGMFKDLNATKIDEIAEANNLDPGDVVVAIEEMEALIRGKIRSEDSKLLKEEKFDSWVYAIDHQLMNINKAKTSIASVDPDKEFYDKEHGRFYMSLRDAFDAENVPAIVESLEKNGYFNGYQFYNQTEEEASVMLQKILSQLGVNVYAGVGDRFSTDRIGNNITIQAKGGPELILNTNHHNVKDARKEAALLRNYLIEHGSFTKILGINDIRIREAGPTISDYRRQMDNNQWNEKQLTKNIEAYEAIEKIYKSGEEEVKIAYEKLNLEKQRIDEEYNEWLLNEAPVVDGQLDEELAASKYNEMIKPLIEKEESILNYAKRVQGRAEEIRYQLEFNTNSFNDAVDAWNKMQSRKGTFEQATINAFLTGTEHLFIGSNKILGDLAIILGHSVVGDFEGIEGHMKEYNNNLERSRGFLTDLGTKPLEQYVQASKENFWYGSWLGFVESAPAMIVAASTGGVGSGALVSSFGFGAQTVSYMSEEIANNSNFDNVSEWEKWAIIAPVAITSAALEKYGFSKWAMARGGGTKIVQKITYEALKKLPKNATTDMLKKAAIGEFKNLIADGVVKITSAGVVEYATGATQAAVEIGVKELYEELKQDDGEYKQIFKTSWDEGVWVLLGDLNDQGMSEMAGSWYGNTPGVLVQNISKATFGKRSTDQQFKMVQAITSDSRMLNNLKLKLKQRSDLPKEHKDHLTKDQYIEHVNALDKTASMFSEVPKNADLQDKKKAFDLINERNLLNKKKENKTIGALELERLKEIEADLNSISEYANKNPQKTRVNTPLLRSAKNNGDLLSAEDSKLVEHAINISNNKTVISGLNAEATVDALKVLSTRLKNSGVKTKKSLAEEVDKMVDFISNKPSSVNDVISIGDPNSIKNGKTQKDIENLYHANVEINGEKYVGETVYFIDNEAISAREFEAKMKNKDFLQKLKNGESNVLILGASLNAKERYFSKLNLDPETKVTLGGEIKMQKNIEAAKVVAEKMLGGELKEGDNYKISKSKKEYKVDLEERGLKGKKLKEALESDAFVDDDGFIVVNKEVSQKLSPTSFTHEVLHKVLDTNFNKSSKEEQKRIIKEFLDILDPKTLSLINDRIKNNYDGVINEETQQIDLDKYLEGEHGLDEFLTSFSDLITTEEVKYNKSLLNKIKDWFKRIFGSDLKNIAEIKDGEQAFEFIKNYSESVLRREGAVKVPFAKELRTKKDFTDEVKEVDKVEKKVTTKKATTSEFDMYDADISVQEEGGIDIAEEVKVEEVAREKITRHKIKAGIPDGKGGTLQTTGKTGNYKLTRTDQDGNKEILGTFNTLDGSIARANEYIGLKSTKKTTKKETETKTKEKETKPIKLLDVTMLEKQDKQTTNAARGRYLDNFITQSKDWLRSSQDVKGTKEYKKVEKNHKAAVKEFLSGKKSARFSISKPSLRFSLNLSKDQVAKANKDMKSFMNDLYKENSAMWNDGGSDYVMDILTQNKVLDKFIVNLVRRTVAQEKPPGWDSESEADLVQQTYIELIPHIRNFNKDFHDFKEDAIENDNFWGWVNPYIKKKLYNSFKKIGLKPAFEADVTEAKDIVYQEEQVATVDKVEKSLRKELGLNEEFRNRVLDKVKTIFKGKLPHPSSPEFKAKLEKEFETALFDVIREDLFGAKFNEEKNRYMYDWGLIQERLDQYAEIIYDKLPIQTLVSLNRNTWKKGELIMKPVIDPKTGEQKRMLPEESDRSRELFGYEVKDREAGNLVWTKQNSSEIKEDFINFFLNPIVSRKAMRMEGLFKVLAKEIAFDATMETVNNPEVYERMQDLYELQGINLLGNELEIIAKEIDRSPGLRFSKSGLRFSSNELNEYAESIYGKDNNAASRFINDATKMLDIAYENTLNYDQAVDKFKNTFPESTYEDIDEEGNVVLKNKILDVLYDNDPDSFNKRTKDKKQTAIEDLISESSNSKQKEYLQRAKDQNNKEGNPEDTKKYAETLKKILPLELINSLQKYLPKAFVDNLFGFSSATDQYTKSYLDIRQNRKVLSNEDKAKVDNLKYKRKKDYNNYRNNLIKARKIASAYYKTRFKLVNNETSSKGYKQFKEIKNGNVILEEKATDVSFYENTSNEVKIYENVMNTFNEAYNALNLFENGKISENELSKKWKKFEEAVDKAEEHYRLKLPKAPYGVSGKYMTASKVKVKMLPADKGTATDRRGRGERLNSIQKVPVFFNDLLQTQNEINELELKPVTVKEKGKYHDFYNNFFKSGFKAVNKNYNWIKDVISYRTNKGYLGELNKVESIEELNEAYSETTNKANFANNKLQLEIYKSQYENLLKKDSDWEGFVNFLNTQLSMTYGMRSLASLSLLQITDVTERQFEHLNPYLWTYSEILNIFSEGLANNSDWNFIQSRIENVIENNKAGYFTKDTSSKIDKALGNVSKLADLRMIAVIDKFNEIYSTNGQSNEQLKKQQLILNKFNKFISTKSSKSAKNNAQRFSKSKVVKVSESMSNEDILSLAATMDAALDLARNPNTPVKKIRVFDFDDTLAQTKSNVLYTMPDGTKGKLTAEEFAQKGDAMAAKGAKWDFSEFNKVMQGKKGPLFEVAEAIQRKRGTEDVFVLTARAPEAAVAIKEFLDSVGLKIPLKNITGLGNSSPYAKSQWVIEKAAEGYNDFYFADDHAANVQAVQDALNQLNGIKSKTQLAKPENKGLRFSFNTRMDLTWKKKSTKLDFLNYTMDTHTASFTLDGNEYEIKMVKMLQEEAAGNLGQVTAPEGNYYDVSWAYIDESGVPHIGMTGIAGPNAGAIIGVVTNGILEFAKNNKVDGLTFSAKELSKVRIYNSLTNLFSNELGWGKRVNEVVFDPAALDPELGDLYSDMIIGAQNDFTEFTVSKHLPVKKDLTNQKKPVRDVMRTIDKGSSTQTNNIRYSKSNLNETFNHIIEAKTGIAADKTFDEIAKGIGKKKGKGKFFMPYSAEDFIGLMYPLLSKGKLGDKQMEWFNAVLFKPFARAMENISRDRNQIMRDFRELKKNLKNVPKNLRKEAMPGLTYENAVRIYLWDKQGFTIPGLHEDTLANVWELMQEQPELQAFADQLLAINKGDGFAKPDQTWMSGTITTDLLRGLNTTKRKKYLEQWQTNVDIIFSKENLLKLEAAYGKKYVESLKDSLRRMKTGVNKKTGGNRLENLWLDWVNNSVGVTMFLNSRSALLQTISAINFINWSDNNPIKAAMAFQDEDQFQADFLMLMNSEFLVDRRSGLRINVSESEIADAAATSTNKIRGILNLLLQKGFVLTQFADSFAIASGGATFYRNRVNTYLKQGLEQKEAEQKAFQDFRELAEESQQSSRPDRISMQQASGIGRVVLAFANTPMQYNRLIKKAFLDLKHGRGDWKTNMSRIVYYGFIQNVIFNALQQALFALAFDDEEEDEEKKKYYKVANGMLDSILRGLGYAGAAISTVKNIGVKFYEESEKDRPKYENVAWEALNISPPIDAKITKLRAAFRALDYEMDEIKEQGFSIDQPAYMSVAQVLSAAFNLPLDRLLRKAENIEAAINEDYEVWQKTALWLGYSEWQIQTQEQKAKEKKEKEEKKALRDPSRYNKNQQVDVLKQFNLTDSEIDKLNTEEKRVKKIKQLEKQEGKQYKPRVKKEKRLSTEEKYKKAIKGLTKKEVQVFDKLEEIYALNKTEQVAILMKKEGLTKKWVNGKYKTEVERVKRIYEIEHSKNDNAYEKWSEYRKREEKPKQDKEKVDADALYDEIF